MSLSRMYESLTAVRRAYHQQGFWEFSGVGTGKVQLIRCENDTVVFKVHGHHYYGGLGQPQPYAPAYYLVCALLDGEPVSGRMEVRPLLEHLVRPVKGTEDPYKP